MRILLLYPPPWKIPAPGQEPDPHGEGPPRHWGAESRFCGDELTLPYGLLTLAAQAKRAGHEVTILNLYAFAWQDVAEIVNRFPADLFGLSSFTSNRRGTLSLAHLLRDLHPGSTIVLGGPHASALPVEMMEHCEAVDGVVTGEGESTFLELVARLETGRSPEGTAGLWWRSGGRIETGPPRERIHELDSLASPYDYCKGHILLTSRGCPGRCTYCGSPALWGSKVRFHSAEYTLSMLERMVRNQGISYINVKDDTFTADRKRVLRICEGIERRGLRFLWSCDTRVDALDEEVLYAMRRAGCQMISLGVESGSPEILESIGKRTTPERTLQATDMARGFGFRIRFYMMACNRGETAETLQTSMDFIQKARPNEFLFSFLTLYPGTEEFEMAVLNGRASREMFFSSDKHYFNYFPENIYEPRMRALIDRIHNRPGVVSFWEYGVAEREKILEVFPHLAAAHMDLGKALFLSGDPVGAEESVLRAMKMGFPLPGLGYNYLAAIRARRRDIRGAVGYLGAAKKCGDFFAVEENLKSIRRWLSTGGMRGGAPPDMVVYHEFEKSRSGIQPVVPAPITIVEPSLPERAASWNPVP
jgi:radical SAM superfamily enzyme YgiQ (UPF0313 family)